MRDKIIATAAAEIGVKESPVNSNNVKYNTWLYGKPVSGKEYAWCGAFVSWVYANSGLPLGTIDYLRGFAGTNYAVNNIHKWGKKIDRAHLLPGDISFYDWDQNGRWDHTGIFVKDLGNDMFEAVEGNTAIGNDSNGGSVMRRQRRYSSAIFVRPNIMDK